MDFGIGVPTSPPSTAPGEDGAIEDSARIRRAFD
jgi:hypothetical protein